MTIPGPSSRNKDGTHVWQVRTTMRKPLLRLLSFQQRGLVATAGMSSCIDPDLPFCVILPKLFCFDWRAWWRTTPELYDGITGWFFAGNGRMPRWRNWVTDLCICLLRFGLWDCHLGRSIPALVHSQKMPWDAGTWLEECWWHTIQSSRLGKYKYPYCH
jgi:hypothetical protein